MQDRRFGPLLIGLLAFTVPGWPGAGVEAEESPFAECERRFAAEPRSHPSVQCFYLVARQQRLGEEAARELDRLRGGHPDNPWLPLYLGKVIYRRSAGAEELFRQALHISERLGDGEAEVEARLALTFHLAQLKRHEEADAMLDPAVRIAEKKGDPGLLAKVSLRKALQSHYQGKDLHSAHVLLKRVEPGIFPHGPEDLKMRWLVATALVSRDLGRNDEARDCKKRLLAMAEEAGDLVLEAETRFDIGILHLTTELPSPAARQKARSLFEETLTAARAAKHIRIEGRAHLELGKLKGGEGGRRHLEACLDIARDLEDPRLLNLCREALAASLAAEDPQTANQLIDLALATARDSNDLWAMAYGSAERLNVRWATLARSEAVADSLDVIDALEALRELQSSGSGRAGLMALLSEAYYWLSGRLLEGSEGSRADLELAFRLTEQLRARVLLETLEAAGAAAAPAAAESLLEELAATLKRKVEIQRRLLDRDLDRGARDGAIAELRVVESKEADLRHSIEQTSPSYAALRKPTLATLEQVEGSLAANEALLSYQIGLDEDFFGRYAGGSWLLVSTRDGTRSYPLPDRVALEPALDAFYGMAEPERAAPAVARLHRDLLAPALADLPPAVERLVILPDGELHRLSFALLRPAAEAEPVIARYQLSVAPSATLWRHWRSLDPPASDAPALALADPLLVPGGDAATGPSARPPVRQWELAASADLPPLPHAREEGRTVVRILGGGSRLLQGEEATERFLKEHDLQRFGVLHFAAHAVIDDEVPERSAVFLAPGAEGEDGWLQPSEIVELELDGRVVVLASCNSATGRVLRGEGVMSLARAFFHAGAPVVVASLRPLPDDWTATVFGKFYRRLGLGESVAGALAGAQREMIRDGAPAVAWAGLVALGNGDLVPFPGGLERPSRLWIAGVLLLAVLAAAGLALFLRRRRTP